MPTFWQAILTLKWVRVTQFLVCDQGSLVGLCMEHYKFLCAAVMICATLVDPKFDFHILTHVTLKSRSIQR